MELISLNVGFPRTVHWNGRMVSTGIFKEPVEGQIEVDNLNLAGDGQADLTVHGGKDKAVYAYPVEHYEYWEKELNRDLPWGMFGENLTITGYLEEEVHVGDLFRIGTAELQVTQPRFPCFKLGIKFNDPGMVKRFAQARRNGYYFRVIKEGVLEKGDAFERISEDPAGLTIAEFINLFLNDKDNRELLEKGISHPVVPEDWKDWFRKRLDK